MNDLLPEENKLANTPATIEELSQYMTHSSHSRLLDILIELRGETANLYLITETHKKEVHLRWEAINDIISRIDVN